MTDEELQSAFESCSLPHDLWTHRAHVRMAYLYASQYPLSAAIDRMRRSIKAYNASQKTPESLESGYHETITVAFMRLIHAALRSCPNSSSDEFCCEHPELLNRTVLRRFYSRERILTLEAKSNFVEPDLCELPHEPKTQ